MDTEVLLRPYQNESALRAGLKAGAQEVGKSCAAMLKRAPDELSPDAVVPLQMIIVDATEYELGAFGVRRLLEQSLEAVVDGLTLLCWGSRAAKGIIVVGAHYPVLLDELQLLLGDRRELGLIGKGLFADHFELDIVACLDVSGGQSSTCWYQQLNLDPTDQAFAVQTLSLEQVMWFARVWASGGETVLPETKLFSVSGDVCLPQVIELEVGQPLTQAVERCEPLGETKLVLVGGALGPLLTPDELALLKVDALAGKTSHSLTVFNHERSTFGIVHNLLREIVKNASLKLEERELLDELYILLMAGKDLAQPNQDKLLELLQRLELGGSQLHIVKFLSHELQTAPDQFRA